MRLCGGMPDTAHCRTRPATLEFIDIYAGLTDNELRRYRQRHPEEGGIVTGFFQQAAERLRRAQETDLETWADNVLDAETLGEVFRPTRA